MTKKGKKKKTKAEKIKIVKGILNAIGSWARNVQEYEFGPEEKPRRKRKH